MKTYRIQTNRFVLRAPDPKDAYILKDAIDKSIEHLRPWLTWTRNEPETVEMKAERLRQYRSKFDADIDHVYPILDPSETVIIGSTGLHSRVTGNGKEIGYWVSADYAHQGYATEVVSSLLYVGFLIEGLDYIEIRCDPRNEWSRRIPQRLGFLHEATLKNRLNDVENNTRDVMIWTMFRENYNPNQVSALNLKCFDVLGREILI